MFPERQAKWRVRRASKRREGHIAVKARTPYLRSNLSVIIFQSLIQLGRRFTIRQTIVRDFIQAALPEIISHFAAVNTVFRGIDTENLAEKLERAFAVTLEIRQDFPHVKMPFGAEAACIEENVTGNRNAHDR